MMELLRRLRGEMSCGQVLEVLQAHLDGEVDAETARKVAQHLDKCQPCDHEASVYTRIKSGLASKRRVLDPVILSQLDQFADRLVVEGAPPQDSD